MELPEYQRPPYNCLRHVNIALSIYNQRMAQQFPGQSMQVLEPNSHQLMEFETEEQFGAFLASQGVVKVCDEEQGLTLDEILKLQENMCVNN